MTTTKWKYKAVPLILTTRAAKAPPRSEALAKALADFEATLNTFGDEGWEVVGYYAVPLWSLPAEAVKIGNMPLIGLANVLDPRDVALLKRPKPA